MLYDIKLTNHVNLTKEQEALIKGCIFYTVSNKKNIEELNRKVKHFFECFDEIKSLDAINLYLNEKDELFEAVKHYCVKKRIQLFTVIDGVEQEVFNPWY